jgi:hypothetical protein
VREAVTASDTIKVKDTFKWFANFAADDEIIIDPQGT